MEGGWRWWRRWRTRYCPIWVPSAHGGGALVGGGGGGDDDGAADAADAADEERARGRAALEGVRPLLAAFERARSRRACARCCRARSARWRRRSRRRRRVAPRTPPAASSKPRCSRHCAALARTRWATGTTWCVRSWCCRAWRRRCAAGSRPSCDGWKGRSARRRRRAPRHATRRGRRCRRRRGRSWSRERAARGHGRR